MCLFNMKTILFVFCGLFVNQAWSYCYAESPKVAEYCVTANGTQLSPGESITYQDKCEQCTCNTGFAEPGSVFLSCCGYGIHAGVIQPPPGCMVTTEEDGCTVKIVSAHNIDQECMFG